MNTAEHIIEPLTLTLPGVVIFVHGVNSDGEWYEEAQLGPAGPSGVCAKA